MQQVSVPLVFAVRPDIRRPYRVEGERANEAGRYHASAREAEDAILRFCASAQREATVLVYTPRGDLWSITEVAADGRVKLKSPEWLARRRAESEAEPTMLTGSTGPDHASTPNEGGNDE